MRVCVRLLLTCISLFLHRHRSSKKSCHSSQSHPPSRVPLRPSPHPQIISAAQTLALHPSSKIAKENLDVFCEAWESQLCDMVLLLREINDVFEGRRGGATKGNVVPYFRASYS